ncbi:MAG: DUF3147 family protein [Pseudomonadota bacterium]|nr:DUF3147 family protein [Pseudomonadota bacterium]MEC9458524.1 DUF3147 family protein [Pseudomonadota bacterium]
MFYIILKIVITACLIALISEIAKVNDRLGGLIAAMPIITFLVIIWMYYEGNSVDKISSHISYTFLYLLPTIPMFLIFPFAIEKFGFYLTLLISIIITVIFVLLFDFLSKYLGYRF